MITEQIQIIHHVSQINQVLVKFLYLPSLLFSFYHKVNGIAWQYGGTSASLKSSLTIFAGSLLSNQTYQFMVSIQNRQNSLLQATGYLLVQIVDTQSQMIIIG
jgi:hypothetical protein